MMSLKPESLSNSAIVATDLEFWVGDTDALPLRVFEMLFTASFLLWIGYCFMTWQEWLTHCGFHLNATELAALGYPPPFGLLSSAGVVCLALGISAAGLAHLCNWSRRWALLGLFASAVYVQGVDLMAAFSLNKLYVAVYGVLLVTPGFRRAAENGQTWVSALAVRMIQATLVIMYFATGLAKAFRGDWLLFNDVLYTQVQGVYRTDAAAWMLRTLPAWAWTVMQWLSLMFELEAPVLFCWRKLRPAALFFGIVYHLMIALVMKDLIFFSAQIWCFYALFITAAEWRAIGATLKRWLQLGEAR